MPNNDYSIVDIKKEFEDHPLPDLNKQRNSNGDFVNDLVKNAG